MHPVCGITDLFVAFGHEVRHPDLVYPPSGRAHAVLVERMLRVRKVQESMRKHPTYIHFASYQSELCLEMDRSVDYGSIKDIFGLAAMS